jgi:exonuclease III
MRLLTLNIRHGGGRQMPAILAGLLRHEPDLVVLSEYRNNRAGEHLREGLAAAGLGCQATSQEAPRVNGLLIAAREPFRVEPHRRLRFDPARLLRVRFDRFSLVGVHLPNLKAKLPHWDALLRVAREADGAPAIYAGDFNTGRVPQDADGFRFTAADRMEALEGLGWVDAWRHMHPAGREFSWYSHRGRGFRLDHIFLSPALAPHLAQARFAHHFREQGASDHSALLVELALGGEGAPSHGRAGRFRVK